MIHPPQRTAAQLGWAIPDPPKGWTRDMELADGARYDNKKRRLRVIASVALQADGNRWLHVSCSHQARIPNWAELRLVKNLFIGDEYAYVVFPPKQYYVNIHPHVLHLWHCLDGPVLPEFTQGTGSL